MTFLFEKIAEEKIKDWLKHVDFSKNKYYKQRVDNSEILKLLLKCEYVCTFLKMRISYQKNVNYVTT